VFLERRRAARERPARADEVAEGVDRPAGLTQDLRPGVQVVGAEVARQAELVGAEGPSLGDDPSGRLLDPFQVATADLARPGARAAGRPARPSAPKARIIRARSGLLPLLMTATNG
jgi:hypothetical protein